jgi:hypothetical protein
VKISVPRRRKYQRAVNRKRREHKRRLLIMLPSLRQPENCPQDYSGGQKGKIVFTHPMI